MLSIMVSFSMISQVVENCWIGCSTSPKYSRRTCGHFGERGQTSTDLYAYHLHGYLLSSAQTWGFHFVRTYYSIRSLCSCFSNRFPTFRDQNLRLIGSTLSPFYSQHLFRNLPYSYRGGCMDFRSSGSIFHIFLPSLFSFYTRSEDSKGCYLLSVVTFFFATLCKESALTCRSYYWPMITLLQEEVMVCR
jgi:hypothetical protein